MIKRVWLAGSVGWTLISVMLGVRVLDSSQLNEVFVVWVLLPWIVGPLVFYLLRYIFTGTFRRRMIPRTYYRRSDV